MLFKGNSSKLELLIEKIQANKENGAESEAGSLANEEVSVGGSSWDVGSDGRGSLSPASSATPTSASETDVEAAATVGVTQTTPYQCSFCDRAFPRLSYLKRHEQQHGMVGDGNIRQCGVSTCSASTSLLASIASASACPVGSSHRASSFLSKKNKRRKIESERKYLEVGHESVASTYSRLKESETVQWTKDIKENVPIKEEDGKTNTCVTRGDEAKSTKRTSKKSENRKNVAANRKRIFNLKEAENDRIRYKSERKQMSCLRNLSQEKRGYGTSREGPQNEQVVSPTKLCDYGTFRIETQLMTSGIGTSGRIRNCISALSSVKNISEGTKGSYDFSRSLKRHADTAQSQLISDSQKDVEVLTADCKSVDNTLSEILNPNVASMNRKDRRISVQDSKRLASKKLSPSDWVQDSVYMYIEKELQELDHCLALSRRSRSVSEEVFDFIEKELMRMDSSIDYMHPSTPMKFDPSRDPLQTPENSSAIWEERSSSFSPVCSEPGGKLDYHHTKSKRFGSSVEHCSGDLNVSCIKKVFSLPSEGDLQKTKIEKRTPEVLCLKHLDEMSPSFDIVDGSFTEKHNTAPARSSHLFDKSILRCEFVNSIGIDSENILIPTTVCCTEKADLEINMLHKDQLPQKLDKVKLNTRYPNKVSQKPVSKTMSRKPIKVVTISERRKIVGCSKYGKGFYSDSSIEKSVPLPPVSSIRIGIGNDVLSQNANDPFQVNSNLYQGKSDIICNQTDTNRVMKSECSMIHSVLTSNTLNNDHSLISLSNARDLNQNDCFVDTIHQSAFINNMETVTTADYSYTVSNIQNTNKMENDVRRGSFLGSYSQSDPCSSVCESLYKYDFYSPYIVPSYTCIYLPSPGNESEYGTKRYQNQKNQSCQVSWSHQDPMLSPVVKPNPEYGNIGENILTTLSHSNNADSLCIRGGDSDYQNISGDMTKCAISKLRATEEVLAVERAPFSSALISVVDNNEYISQHPPDGIVTEKGNCESQNIVGTHISKGKVNDREFVGCEKSQTVNGMPRYTNLKQQLNGELDPLSIEVPGILIQVKTGVPEEQESSSSYAYFNADGECQKWQAEDPKIMPFKVSSVGESAKLEEKEFNNESSKVIRSTSVRMVDKSNKVLERKKGRDDKNRVEKSSVKSSTAPQDMLCSRIVRKDKEFITGNKTKKAVKRNKRTVVSNKVDKVTPDLKINSCVRLSPRQLYKDNGYRYIVGYSSDLIKRSGEQGTFEKQDQSKLSKETKYLVVKGRTEKTRKKGKRQQRQYYIDKHKDENRNVRQLSVCQNLPNGNILKSHKGKCNDNKVKLNEGQHGQTFSSCMEDKASDMDKTERIETFDYADYQRENYIFSKGLNQSHMRNHEKAVPERGKKVIISTLILESQELNVSSGPISTSGNSSGEFGSEEAMSCNAVSGSHEHSRLGTTKRTLSESSYSSQDCAIVNSSANIYSQADKNEVPIFENTDDNHKIDSVSCKDYHNQIRETANKSATEEMSYSCSFMKNGNDYNAPEHNLQTWSCPLPVTQPAVSLYKASVMNSSLPCKKRIFEGFKNLRPHKQQELDNDPQFLTIKDREWSLSGMSVPRSKTVDHAPVSSSAMVSSEENVSSLSKFKNLPPLETKLEKISDWNSKSGCGGNTVVSASLPTGSGNSIIEDNLLFPRNEFVLPFETIDMSLMNSISLAFSGKTECDTDLENVTTYLLALVENTGVSMNCVNPFQEYGQPEKNFFCTDRPCHSNGGQFQNYTFPVLSGDTLAHGNANEYIYPNVNSTSSVMSVVTNSVANNAVYAEGNRSAEFDVTRKYFSQESSCNIANFQGSDEVCNMEGVMSGEVTSLITVNTNFENHESRLQKSFIHETECIPVENPKEQPVVNSEYESLRMNLEFSLKDETCSARETSTSLSASNFNPNEEQDLLDLALKTDLFDVLSLDEQAMSTWPDIEETSPLVLPSPNEGYEKSKEHAGDFQACQPQTSDNTVAEFQNILTGYDTPQATVGASDDNRMESVENKPQFVTAHSGFQLPEDLSVRSHTSCSGEQGMGETNPQDVLLDTDEEVVKLKDEEGKESSDLNDVMTHADQLPFRCEFCGRLFKHKRSRDRHVKLHTGDKKYKCCHCEAAFSRSDHLKIHMKTHDTQKPYQCSVCNRGYNTAAALTAHMQSHKAKLTAHALNQLLKDAQAPSDNHAITQLLRDSASEVHSQALNHFLKDTQKEQLLSPRGGEQGIGGSPGAITASSVGEPSPTLSPVATVRCPTCHSHCRNHAHLQKHISRYHGEDSLATTSERPASRGGASSIGGASSTPSTPSPRPPSSLPSPRPLANPLLSLVGGKLACLYCSRDSFPSLEALQLHLHSAHGSVMNGDVRDVASMLNLPTSLGASLSAGGLASSLASPLGPGSSRGVSCELCGARVGGVTALQRHVVTAHTFTDLLARAAEGVFCAQCLLPFSNPGALAEHIKLVHTAPVLSAVLSKRPPSPPTDTPTDLSKKSRHDGLPSDLPASTLLCSQCNAPFTNFEAFRRHLKTHLEGGEQISSSVVGAAQVVCPECRLPLTSEAALEAHLATHLGVTSTEYGCQACLKLFSKPDELQKHLMDIHAHHLYRCALCKEMFDSKVSIQVHFAVKHSNECKVHKCTRCSLIFRSQSEFEVHIRVSHMRRGQGGGDPVSGGGSGGSYRCLLCTLSLSSEAELAAHVATHQRQFQCSLCDDAFHVEFLLDKHMQTQHNSELNGNVSQPENLAKPRRSPQKKDLKCDICDAEFSSESGLLTHRKQTHNIKSGTGGSGAKVAAASLSLFCAYCNEACKSRGDLEAHMKSHQGTGGRHKCNICDELCLSAALLAQHKLTHVKVVSGSACAICREPLTSEQQFSSHQNDHHPPPLPQPCVVCRQTLVTDVEVSVHARFHAAQAAQAAAAASVASSIFSSGELLSSSPSAVITTTAAITGVTSSNGNSRGSSSPRHSPVLRCPECHVKLESMEEAEAHAASHHSQHQGFSRSMAPSSRTYQCIKCQESFASEAEIEAHVASHLLHEGSIHECHLCQATFDTPLRLQCHLIEHTFEGCGSFTCYMCSSVFTTASRLQQHMVEHGLSARPYDCHHCHQRFFFRAELENHALSHPEAVDGSCRECYASFPELPRRSLRRPSMSCLNSIPHMVAQLSQDQGSTETKLLKVASPFSPCDGSEKESGPTNGHLVSLSEPKSE